MGTGTVQRRTGSGAGAYVVQELIHSGASSAVYRIDHQDKKLILKKYSTKFLADLEREKSILKRLKHKNIISTVPLMVKNSLVLEYHGCSLRDSLGLPGNMANTFIFRQILDGVGFLHRRSIVHCDLKPENILLHNNVVKIIDFGSARCVNASSTHVSSTNTYSALELLLGIERITGSVDVWALGCIFYEMLTGEPLFTGDNVFSVINQILKVLGSPSRGDYDGLVIEHLGFLNVFKGAPPPAHLHPDQRMDSFLGRFFVFDPRRRITVVAALKSDVLE